jgi:hypothetical protein
MTTVRQVNGYIIPDHSTILAAVHSVVNELRLNATQQQQFRQNPRLYLGLRGLNVDLQSELIRDLTPAFHLQEHCQMTSVCAWTQCALTCVITECAVTNALR